jgi:hypothetical protein
MTDPDPVAALARELEQLRGQWARSQGEIGALRERLESSTGQVAKLLLQVKHLRGEIADKRQAESPPAPWWCVDQEQYPAMHAELAGWVDGFLVPQYGDYLRNLPQCLLSHPAAVWELSTLRAEWERIFADPDDGELQGLLAFQDRYLPGALARLGAALADCKNNYCRLTRPR